MDGASRRRLTDATTLSRIPIALLMLMVRRHRRAVTCLFVLGAATDVVDGPLARRLGTQSDRGARLDSLADAVLVVAASCTAAATVDVAARQRVGRAAAVVAATRLITLSLTRHRFGTWSVMHTPLNKATGLGLTAVSSVALISGRMPLLALTGVGALAELAAIDELMTVTRSSDYDADGVSVRHRASHRFPFDW